MEGERLGKVSIKGTGYGTFYNNRDKNYSGLNKGGGSRGEKTWMDLVNTQEVRPKGVVNRWAMKKEGK